MIIFIVIPYEVPQGLSYMIVERFLVIIIKIIKIKLVERNESKRWRIVNDDTLVHMVV